MKLKSGGEVQAQHLNKALASPPKKSEETEEIGNDERDSTPQTEAERHQPDRFVVHRIVRLHRDRGEGRPSAEERFRWETRPFFRSRDSDQA